MFRYLDTFPRPPDFPVWPELVPEPTLGGHRGRGGRRGLVAIGDPDECINTCRTYEAIGADQLTFGMLSTTMPVEVAIEAVETFGRHVIGVFDTRSGAFDDPAAPAAVRGGRHG